MKKIILITIFIVTTSAASAQVSPEDYQALKAIYNSLGGKNWNNATGWDFSGSEADVKPYNKQSGTGWFGISQISKGRVEKLELIENNLAGAIPTEITKLTAARTINLSKNAITGSLPSTIGELERITILDLSNNQISGEIPSSLLDMGKNGYSRIQSEGKSGTDIKVHLYNNSLSGSLPLSIGSMELLKKEARSISLNLSNNRLSGEIPSSITALVELTALQLAGNQLEGAVPAGLEVMPKLSVIRLEKNKLSGYVPQKK